MRFDAANKFYVILTDKENPFDNWKSKRNVRLLKNEINEKANAFEESRLNQVPLR